MIGTPNSGLAGMPLAAMACRERRRIWQVQHLWYSPIFYGFTHTIYGCGSLPVTGRPPGWRIVANARQIGGAIMPDGEIFGGNLSVLLALRIC